MATMKIQVGDTVTIRKGRNKGESGKVLKVSSDKKWVVVEGVNIQVKHQKPNVKPNVDAGIYKNPGKVSIANVGIAVDKTKTGRIGFNVENDGAKKRVFKANGKEVK